MKQTLVEHNDALTALAKLLQDTEVVDRAGLDALLAGLASPTMKSAAH